MRWMMIVLMVMGLLLSPLAAEIEKGNSEVSISANRQGMTMGEGSAEIKLVLWTVVGSYGYFISEVNEIGGSLVLTKVSITQEDFAGEKDTDSTGMANIGFFFTHHFIVADPRYVPYAGADVAKGFMFGYEDDAPSIYGAGVYTGVKYYLSEKTTIGPEFQLRMMNMGFDGESETVYSNLFMIKLSTLF